MDLGREIRTIQVDEETEKERQPSYQPLIEFAKLIGNAPSDEGFDFETRDKSSVD